MDFQKTSIIKPRAHRPDYLLALSVLTLCLIGIVMISSASVVASYADYGNNTYYLYHQLSSLVLGIILWVIAYKINYNFWRKAAPFLLFLNFLLLVAVFIPGIGHGSGGAQRWIKIANFTFQPTEAIKLTLILYLAAWLEKKGKEVKNFLYGTFPFLIMIGFIAFLIMLQPDLSTMTIIVITAAIMFFVAGASLWHLTWLGGVGIFVIWALIKTAPYRMARFTIFLDPGTDPRGTGYQINQALLAIGSGGLWGLGFGRSRQKYNFLPGASTDSIFAITAEELGLIRVGAIILIFVFLAYRGFKIAKEAPCTFSRLISIGIISWLIFQTFFNLASMLSLVPLTGVPLPFLSYGGSSLVVSLIGVGIIMNISKYTKSEAVYEDSRFRWWDWRSYFSLTRRYGRD
ncbi:MAG: putative lipid II flippase FtsW [Candidatus Aenigmarchaeota archaeon]|nr:putative lipid II flippase FtsW [Candidatus Aenigmarchaeota archaeon]